MNLSVSVETGLAIDQWTKLRDAFIALGHEVDLVEPLPGQPDMVFAANGGTVVDGVAYGAQFRHAERADEAPAFRSWFVDQGFATHDAKEINEGEGDLLLTGRYLLAGTGFRTAHAAHAEAQELFGRPTVTLQLVDPRFYHLDTALAVLDESTVAYLPEAFSPGSRRVLEELFPDAVKADLEDALVLGLNAVSDGHHVVLPVQAHRLADQLARRGYEPVGVDVSELRKAGGGPKCCTLEVRT
jgi:N-dimethylarginine dimethylaminohydrolase